jgi:hypothetical protein
MDNTETQNGFREIRQIRVIRVQEPAGSHSQLVMQE